MAEDVERRLELKTKAADSDITEIRAWVRTHPAGFVQAYPPRQVNSIYFDTPVLTSFAENLSGQSARRKLRLRWYGTDDRKAVCVVEAKCKRGGLGWKLTRSLPSVVDLTRIRWVDLTALIRRIVETDLDLYLGDALTPVILNRYRREYFVTMDGRVRITLDADQRLHDQRFVRGPNLHVEEPPSAEAVVEFKASKDDGDRLAGISSTFPIRLEKSSKYVDGVHRLLTL